MKSRLISKDEQEEEITYPCLMKSVLGTVVLFVDKGAGTVVIQGSHNWRLGNFVSNWNEGDFTPLPKGSIVELVQE